MRNKPDPNPNHKLRHPTAVGETPMLRAHWLTHIAFAISLIVVIARLTTPDALRDPWEIMPGSDFVPSAPGPATGLVFDLLACLPTVLILMRRAVDLDYRLSLRWSHSPLFALAAWAVLSTAWASDQFAAAITSAHFFAAASLLWAMSQLVKTAGRFRFVTAVCFGLLLVLVVQSAMYKFIDVPQNISYWYEHKTEILKAHNWQPDSFAATQFAQKLTRGELVGFFNSANTFAAVGVLLFTACIGIGIQKLVDRDRPPWMILILVSVFSLCWILFWAASKAAAATPLVGVLALCLFIVFHQRLRSKHALTYFGGVAFVGAAMLAVVGHGLHHHGLFPGHLSNSLDFRWKYWIASSGILKEHPLIGVGWSNFGLHYLAHRLPEAAEEIKDPHSFLVRFFVELGIVGGMLCILWLLRLAWELTLPGNDLDQSKPDDSGVALGQIIVVLLLGMLLSVLGGVDFSLPFADIVLLLGRPILYLMVLLLGSIVASMRSGQIQLSASRSSTDPRDAVPFPWNRIVFLVSPVLHHLGPVIHLLASPKSSAEREVLDDRPAPWIYYCTLTGLGLFLLHNLIDFSWFEPGAMFAFMALIGSVQGMATDPHRDMGLRPMTATLEREKTLTSDTPSTGRRPVSRGRGLSLAVAGLCALAWLTVAGTFVVPVIAAEELAVSANESIRTASFKEPDEFGRHFQTALQDLKEAASWVPYNSDYVYRQAMALTYLRQDAAAKSLLDRVKRINPMQSDAYLLDANIELRADNPHPNLPAVKTDYQTVLALNPNDVSLHIQYAQALDRFVLRAEAKQQYELALAADAALPIGEPKRLSPADVEKYKKEAARP